MLQSTLWVKWRIKAKKEERFNHIEKIIIQELRGIFDGTGKKIKQKEKIIKENRLNSKTQSE